MNKHCYACDKTAPIASVFFESNEYLCRDCSNLAMALIVSVRLSEEDLQKVITILKSKRVA